MLDSTVKLNSVLNGPLAPLGRGLGEGKTRTLFSDQLFRINIQQTRCNRWSHAGR